MDSIYLISLIVGGFFVLLSIFGGADHESDHDVHLDAEHDFDFDSDSDIDFDSDHDFGSDLSNDVGVVDLLSIRALFLFAAFFGLTGIVLGALGTSEPFNGILSGATGLVVGIGGNFIIKKFAYEHVSSQVTQAELSGKTARVLLPFKESENGTILLEAGGKRIQVTARLFDPEQVDALSKGDEVVVVNMNGRIAEVLRPD